MMKAADILGPNLEPAQAKWRCIGHDTKASMAGVPHPVRFIETPKPAFGLSK